MYKIIGGDQQEYGPSSAEEIRQWIADGRADGRTLVQVEGTREWKPLASFPEFGSLTGPKPAQPPPIGAPPPRIVPPNAPRNFAASVLSLNPRLSIGDCLNGGWHLLTANAGVLLPAVMLVCGCRLFLSIIPVLGVLGLLFTGAFYGGLYVVFLKRLRNQPTSVGEGFSGFGDNFTQLLLVGFISLLLTFIGLGLCIIPGIYLFVIWAFAIPLVADKRMGFWDAMELSRKVVSRHWIQIAALLLLCFLPVILFAIYSNMVASQYISSLIQSGQLDPSLFLNNPPKFMAQITAAGKQLAEKYLYLALFQQLLLLLVQPFAKAVIAYAYEVLFNPGSTPPA
jgi:hypothetical protein